MMQLTKSGLKPRPLSSRTLFWVGLDFCSPFEPGYKQNIIHAQPPWFLTFLRFWLWQTLQTIMQTIKIIAQPLTFFQLTWGTRLTWITQKLSRPTRNWNWRKASTKGMLSMSPIVPPSCDRWWTLYMLMRTDYPMGMDQAMDHCPINQNFELNKSRQKFHHSLKEHHKISNIPKFRCKML
jgi:hypothetical protein